MMWLAGRPSKGAPVAMGAAAPCGPAGGGWQLAAGAPAPPTADAAAGIAAAPFLRKRDVVERLCANACERRVQSLLQN
eukprot:scaffold57532_cov63-Phaeocystis_antarctica.AAC.2